MRKEEEQPEEGGKCCVLDDLWCVPCNVANFILYLFVRPWWWFISSSSHFYVLASVTSAGHQIDSHHSHYVLLFILNSCWIVPRMLMREVGCHKWMFGYYINPRRRFIGINCLQCRVRHTKEKQNVKTHHFLVDKVQQKRLFISNHTPKGLCRADASCRRRIILLRFKWQNSERSHELYLL